MDWSGSLRDELRVRADAWAASTKTPAFHSLGRRPTVIFEPIDGLTGHGNFHPDSWRAIMRDPGWSRRLEKAHPQRRALPESKRALAKELDSSNSSDALLMNCFCFPRALSRLLAGLELPGQASVPEFGWSPCVELSDGSGDTTEVDMRLGDLILEAKLTEHDFTTRPKQHVRRYRRLREQFDTGSLPVVGDSFKGYQLIRNVLAAEQHGATLIVLLDQRRPDLLQEWWSVHAAIMSPTLRRRCGFRTWQQVAASSPPKLASFLAEKYGIRAAV